MPYSLNLIGVQLDANDVRTNAQGPLHKLGTTTLGSDGRKYIYFKSDANGVPDATRISIATATSVATEAASGGWVAIGATAADGYGWAASVENYTAGAGTPTVVA